MSTGSGWTAPGSSGAPHEGHSEPPASPTARDGGEHPGAPGAGPTPGQGAGGPRRELSAELPLFPLRPLGVGEILGAATRIYRLRPRATFALAAIVYGVAYLFTTLFTGASMIPMLNDMQAVFSDPAAMEPGVTTFGSLGDVVMTIAASVVTGAITMVATSFVTAALTRLAIGEATGDPLPEGGTWKVVRRFGLRAVLASFLVGVLGVAAFSVPAAIGVVPLVLLQEPSVVTIGAVVLGAVVGLLAVLYVWARTLLTVPALVIEDLGVLGAVRRAFALTAGRKLWRVLGMSALLMLISILAVQAVSGVFGLIAFIAYVAILLATSLEGLIVGAMIMTVIMMIGTYLATVLLAPFTAAGTAAIYADSRIRHEAWDVELTRRLHAAREGSAGPSDGAAGMQA